MPSSHTSRTFLRVLLAIFCFSLSLTATAQTLSFTRVQGPTARFYTHIDLNNDGREDFIDWGDSSTNTFKVILSTGDGTYAAPVVYTAQGGLPSYFAVGDFNNDGSNDIVYTVSGSSTFYEWLNNGAGTFRYAAQFTTDSTQGLRGVAAGDFNHDGNIDLAVAYDGTHVRTYFGDGHGSFSPGPISAALNSASVQVGDFNGDGKADVFTNSKDYGSSGSVLYGDGTGNFPTRFDINDEPAFNVADVNGDGISDLIGQPFSFSINGSTYHNSVRVWYGNPSNTMTSGNIPLGRCGGIGDPNVADFNGDGLPDIAVQEVSSCSGSGPYILSILVRNADGTYQPEHDISSSTRDLRGITPIRANQDTKPDIAISEIGSTANDNNIAVFLNNTGGNFPSCTAPVDAMEGINICSPGSSTSTTAVHFGIGAGGQTPMRKVEVWADGNKLAEQLSQSFSHYAFLDKDTTLSAGTHTIDVYAAGWDNMLQHTAFTVNVASSGGGGGGCGQPTVPGVSICSPTPGANEPSTFTISAAGRNSGPTAGLDVWLDGHKVGWYPGTSVNIQTTAGAGSHQLDVYAVGVNGELQHASVTFNVTGGGGGTCTQSTPGVHICSPFQGGSFTSPVHVVAAGMNNGPTAGLDVWMDGTKVGWYPGSSLDIYVPANAGSHQIDIYAVGTNGELQVSSVSFFVDAGTGGGGGSCPAPATAGVNVCAPAQGSTVTTPVRISATGKNDGYQTRGLDVWLDGTKVGFYESPSIDISVPMSQGSHTLEIFAIPFTSGGYSTPPKATVTFTVSGTGSAGGGYSGTCDAPADANTLNMCSPVSGSNIPSPVRVAVHGGTNIDTIEMWYDGVKTLVASGAGGQYIDIPYGMPSGSHKIDFYGKSGGAVLDHKFTQFTVTSAASGDVQYAVPLHRLTAGPGAGQVSVTTGGDVTASVSGWTEGTYGLKFCMYPATVYPDSSCLNLGSLTIAPSGNGTTTVHFPQSGTWAGLFRVYDSGGNRVLETSGALNSNGSAYGETYSAKVMTWVPSSTTNTAGAEVNGPQDPGTGTISVDYANVVLRLTGAAPNTTYSVIQCYMGGSSCIQIGETLTNASGDSSHAMPLTPGPVGVFRLSRTGASGFVSGFRVP